MRKIKKPQDKADLYTQLYELRVSDKLLEAAQIVEAFSSELMEEETDIEKIRNILASIIDTRIRNASYMKISSVNQELRDIIKLKWVMEKMGTIILVSIEFTNIKMALLEAAAILLHFGPASELGQSISKKLLNSAPFEKVRAELHQKLKNVGFDMPGINLSELTTKEIIQKINH